MSQKTIFTRPVKKRTFAEQMAESIREAILSGELASGAALPTEPELAEQFGVSRAVVRDATRLLMAQGLVQVEHGRGVFVTPPLNEAFGEALLLALRRAGATAWDVEQFNQIIYPEVAALAAARVTDEEVAEIRRLAEENLRVIAEYQVRWWRQTTPPAEQARYKESFFQVLQAIFAATHNQVFRQLARPLYDLRNLRDWADAEDSTPEEYIELEKRFLLAWVEAIASRDPQFARQSIQRLMVLPPEAMHAMQHTAVGEVTVIPVPPDLS